MAKKKRSVRVPGGKSVVHTKRKKPRKHHCGRCGKELHGTPNAPASEIRKLSRTEKVPERPYAGVLCSECLDRLVRYTTRFEAKFRHPEFSDLPLGRDLTIERFLPAGWWKSTSKEKEMITT